MLKLVASNGEEVDNAAVVVQLSEKTDNVSAYEAKKAKLAAMRAAANKRVTAEYKLKK